MSNGNTSGGDGSAGNPTTDSSIIKPAQLAPIVAVAAAVSGVVGAAVGTLLGQG